MAAHFIDMGQADCTLLEFPCGAVIIDAGAQDDDVFVPRLIDYLEKFFQRRTDLHRTLDSIIITHNHIDHTRALPKIVTVFNVRRLIHNGQLHQSGSAETELVGAHAHDPGHNLTVRKILDTDIPNPAVHAGLTDADIDPLSCAKCDPKIVLLSGQRAPGSGLNDDDFKDANNHSIVVRVDFGQVSFLFTGDMETHALKLLTNRYAGTHILDADVYHVGHHGSDNGTVQGLLSVLTPKIAVISVGHWNFGKNDPHDLFTTWHYSHPRKETIDLLKAASPSKRIYPIYATVFKSQFDPRRIKVNQNIYATAWDGNIIIHGTLDGQLVPTRKN